MVHSRSNLKTEIKHYIILMLLEKICLLIDTYEIYCLRYIQFLQQNKSFKSIE